MEKNGGGGWRKYAWVGEKCKNAGENKYNHPASGRHPAARTRPGRRRRGGSMTANHGMLPMTSTVMQPPPTTVRCCRTQHCRPARARVGPRRRRRRRRRCRRLASMDSVLVIMMTPARPYGRWRPALRADLPSHPRQPGLRPVRQRSAIRPCERSFPCCYCIRRYRACYQS